MLYILAVILGLIAGTVSKGKLSNIKNIRINKAWLIIMAYLIQILAQVTAIRGIDFAVRYSVIVEAVVFGMLLIALWFNRHYAGMILIAAGSILNIVVMMCNGGKMPVNASAINISDGKHILADKFTRLPFLGDIISPPGVLGYANSVVSVGDLVVILGLAVLIFELMKMESAKTVS